MVSLSTPFLGGTCFLWLFCVGPRIPLLCFNTLVPAGAHERETLLLKCSRVSASISMDKALERWQLGNIIFDTGFFPEQLWEDWGGKTQATKG